ncbi:MAG: Na+/H+ antiporter subunit E [Verrucomicrobiota bacterium]
MARREPKVLLYRCLIFGLLFATWMVFSGFFDLFHLSLGVISCGLVTWFSSDLLFANRTTGIVDRLRQSGRFLTYSIWLLWQVLLANLHLLRLAFSPRSALQPQIIRHETILDSDFEKFLLANSITLTPGTVTIKIVGSTFYIHAINEECAKGVDGEMDRRISHIFASSSEKG